jgi:hypothetical protein
MGFHVRERSDLHNSNFSTGANKPDINNLKLVLHCYDQPVGIPLYVENDTVVAKNTRRAVRCLDVLRAGDQTKMADRRFITSL